MIIDWFGLGATLNQSGSDSLPLSNRAEEFFSHTCTKQNDVLGVSRRCRVGTPWVPCVSFGVMDLQPEVTWCDCGGGKGKGGEKCPKMSQCRTEELPEPQLDTILEWKAAGSPSTESSSRGFLTPPNPPAATTGAVSWLFLL